MNRPIDHAMIAAAALALRTVEIGAYPTVADAIADLVADGATLDYSYPGVPDGHWVHEHWYPGPDDIPLLMAVVAAIDQGHEHNADIWTAALELMEDRS